MYIQKSILLRWSLSAKDFSLGGRDEQLVAREGCLKSAGAYGSGFLNIGGAPAVRQNGRTVVCCQSIKQETSKESEMKAFAGLRSAF